MTNMTIMIDMVGICIPLLCQSGLLQPLELYPPGRNLRKLVLSLLRNPAFRAAAKNLRKPYGHLSRDARSRTPDFLAREEYPSAKPHARFVHSTVGVCRK
jgi:hypothetical protein